MSTPKPPDDQPQQREEITLTREDERILDEVWRQITEEDAQREQDQAGKTSRT